MEQGLSPERECILLLIDYGPGLSICPITGSASSNGPLLLTEPYVARVSGRTPAGFTDQVALCETTASVAPFTGQRTRRALLAYRLHCCFRFTALEPALCSA